MPQPLLSLFPPSAGRPLKRRPRWLALLLLGGVLAAAPALAPAVEAPAKAAAAKSGGGKTTKGKATAGKSKAASSKGKASGKTASGKQSPARKKGSGTRKAGKGASPSQQDLARLQAEIRNAEQRIKLTREQREQKEAELFLAEVEIGTLRENMGSVQKDVSSREQRLRALQAERIRREQDKGRLVNQIRSDLQMAQRQGGQDHYKLLLNQQDPQTLARLMKYYGYMQQARAGRVQALNQTLARLDELQQEEEENVGKLRSLRGELQQKQSRLSVAQQQRSEAIRTLSAQMESDEEKLQRLRRDQQALQSVMDRLARESVLREQKAREQRERDAREAEKRRQQQAATPPADTRAPEAGKRLPPPPPPPPAVEPEPRDFAITPYKGRCPLPAAGGVRARFGAARAGGLRWNGVVIDAAAGTPVRAIRPGRVAFADYLRGYGFLVIVDHGRGLMSLYGQNRSLAKKAGDAVAGNEVIASVGDSGGSETDGLYFEIRVRGRPSDPAEWCAYK